MVCVARCLQVRKQTLYILQVLPSGIFVKVQYIGPHCSDDDEFVLEMQEEQERRWLSQNPQVTPLMTASTGFLVPHRAHCVSHR